VNDVYAYPEVDLSLLSADVDWSVSGTDSLGCNYSGHGTFHVSEDPGAGDESITIFDGVLRGSPTYRGYMGEGYPWNGTQITYDVTGGEDCPGSETENATSFLEIPMLVDRANIKAPPSGGVLSGFYKQDEPGDAYQMMTWNLTPQTK